MKFDFQKISKKLTGAIASYFTVGTISKNLGKISPELATNPMYAGLAMIGIGIFLPDFVKMDKQQDAINFVGDSLIFAGVTVALPSVTSGQLSGGDTSQIPDKTGVNGINPNEANNFIGRPYNQVKDYINGIGCPQDIILNVDGTLSTTQGKAVSVDTRTGEAVEFIDQCFY
jgi:hypothetical protein